MTGTEGNGYWRLIEPVWHRVRIYDGPRAFTEQFEQISVSQQNLLASHWCKSEVCNGGFHQFFMNPTGLLSPEAADAFSNIGLPETAAIVRQAMAFFGPEFPRDQHVRQAALEAVKGESRAQWDPFFSLDDRFYASLDDRGGYEAIANQYAAIV